jgi:hypothetical protein
MMTARFWVEFIQDGINSQPVSIAAVKEKTAASLQKLSSIGCDIRVKTEQVIRNSTKRRTRIHQKTEQHQY